MYRRVATAAAVGVALAALPSAAQAQDMTSPVLNAATLSPVSPVPQRNGNPPAAPSTSTGNNGWFTQAAPVTINVTATDEVGVSKIQYSTDNGATWLDATITPGTSVTAAIPQNAEGNNTIRFRAQDAAGNFARGVAANTTLSAAAAVGATGVRLASTNGRAVGDELVINTGDGQETVWDAKRCARAGHRRARPGAGYVRRHAGREQQLAHRRAADAESVSDG